MSTSQTSGRRRTGRRGLSAWIAVAMAVTLVTAALPVGAPATAAESTLPPPPTVADLNIAPEMVPPDMGQTPFQVYVDETQHTIRGQMLDYWRANGAASVYGYPISEPFASEDGYYSQAFERAIFRYVPDYLYTEDPTVRLTPISQTVLTDRLDNFRADGRRDSGGGDRRGSAWRALDPEEDTTVANGGVYVEQTGHTISGAQLTWYGAHEGDFYLGNPISEPHTERGMIVQYFEGGLLMTGEDGASRLAPLVAEHTGLLGVETAPVARGDLPSFDEQLFWTEGNPHDADPYAPGRKRIEVSISQQTLWAYQGDELVLQTLVSTGLDPNNTEIGRFRVRIKKELEDMSGFTSATGEVIGLGDGSGVQSGIPYEVKDVPHVMYINLEAEALHGAYWHDNFGERMSHGCINLPLDVAAFLYGWAPLGTEVRVYE